MKKKEGRRFKLIVCEILFRETCHCAARTGNIIDITFMGKGLHNIGDSKMSSALQEEIDQAKTDRYEAILLGYGLCNNGIQGLHASLPMVVPRAHDCITLLLGSKEKYRAYFDKNPGTYFQSTGWMERDVDFYDGEISVMEQLGINKSFQDYVEKYGEENARYIMETLGDGLRNYSKLAYIDTGIGEFPEYEKQSQEMARQNNWEYEKLKGSYKLLMRLMEGDWDPKDFLVTEPGKTIQPTNDEGILATEGCACCRTTGAT